MTFTLSPSPWFTGLDNAGVTLPGAKLFCYASGTTTKLGTYTDAAGSAANTNPIILDSAGRAVIYLQPLAYKFVLAPANDTDPPTSPIKTIDPVNPAPETQPSLDVVGINGESQDMVPGDAVYLSDGTGLGTTAGRWFLMSGNQGPLSTGAPAVGVVTALTVPGGTVTVRLQGRMTGYAGLVPGSAYYSSSGLIGTISATAPACARVIGYADTATSLILAEKREFGLARIAGFVGPVGNIGAGEDILATRTSGQYELSGNMGWEGTFFGISANNANAKTLRVRLIETANNTIIMSIPLTINEAGRWLAKFTVIRLSTTTFMSIGQASVGPNTAAVTVSANTEVNGGTCNWQNLVELRLTGESGGAATDDIVMHGGFIQRLY